MNNPTFSYRMVAPDVVEISDGSHFIRINREGLLYAIQTVKNAESDLETEELHRAVLVMYQDALDFMDTQKAVAG